MSLNRICPQVKPPKEFPGVKEVRALALQVAQRIWSLETKREQGDAQSRALKARVPLADPYRLPLPALEQKIADGYNILKHVENDLTTYLADLS